jgi:hypothetical protein
MVAEAGDTPLRVDAEGTGLVDLREAGHRGISVHRWRRGAPVTTEGCNVGAGRAGLAPMGST